MKLASAIRARLPNTIYSFTHYLKMRLSLTSILKTSVLLLIVTLLQITNVDGGGKKKGGAKKKQGSVDAKELITKLQDVALAASLIADNLGAFEDKIMDVDTKVDKHADPKTQAKQKKIAMKAKRMGRFGRGSRRFMRGTMRMMGRIGPFLGGFGAVMTIATLFLGGGGESAEMSIMKDEFTKIDANFGKVFGKFEETANLLKQTAIKTQFSKYNHAITHANNLMYKYLGAEGNTRKVYYSQFMETYQQADPANSIYIGLTKRTQLVSNIFQNIVEFTNEHRKQVQTIIKGIFALLLKGIKVDLFYQKLAHPNDTLFYDVTLKDWTTKGQEVLKRMEEIDKKVVAAWRSRADTDMDRNLAKMASYSNQKIAARIHAFMVEKFDWMYWHVLVLDSKLKPEQRFLHYCDAVTLEKYGKIVVASYEDSFSESGCPIAAGEYLNSTESSYLDTSSTWSDTNMAASIIFTRMNPYLKDCKNVKGITIVLQKIGKKEYADIGYAGDPDRIVISKSSAYHMQAFV